MTASGAVPATAAGAPPSSEGARTWAVPAVIIAATLLAVGLRLYDLSRPGYLFGISEYDDGTDFGSAIRLVHGGVPYRDFIMVQPPGITLIMFPIALITKGMGTITGMAVARVFTALASAAAVPVAGLLVRHRGFFATLVACGVLAIYPDSVLAARTVLLEPWLVLFCLLGALAVFDRDEVSGSWRRLLAGGVLFGFAGAVKVWAIIPVVVILALTARRPRRAAVYAAGVVLGFCVPVLPFALTAPATFYHSVIIAQLVRNDLVRIPQGYRLQQILGLVHVNQLATPPLVIIGIVVVLIVAAVSVLGSRLAHSRPPALDWFVTGTCALLVAAFLWPADFYYHYAGFIAPFVGLVIALPVSRLLSALPSDQTRRLAQADAAVGHRDRRRRPRGPDRVPGHRRGTRGLGGARRRDRTGQAHHSGGRLCRYRPGLLHDRDQPFRVQRAGLLAHDRRCGHRLCAVQRPERGNRRRELAGRGSGLDGGVPARLVRVAHHPGVPQDPVDPAVDGLFPEPLRAADRGA